MGEVLLRPCGVEALGLAGKLAQLSEEGLSVDKLLCGAELRKLGTAELNEFCGAAFRSLSELSMGELTVWKSAQSSACKF